MRQCRSAVLIVLASAAALLAGVDRASACSCMVPGPPCEHFWQMDTVFIGRVAKITTLEPKVTPAGGPPWISREVEFELVEPFRGVAESPSVTVGTGRGGGDCGYPFKIGDTYIVYANTDRKSGQLTTGICSRTRPIADAGADVAYARAVRTSPAAGGTISGVVRDGDRRKPGASEYLPRPNVAVVFTREGVDYRVVSDAAGRFEIGGLPVGRYAVRAEPGPDDYADPFPRDVAVADPRGCATVTIVVRHDGRVAGRIVDSTGAAVPFMPVHLWNADYMTNVGSRFHAPYETRSDRDGRFTFSRVGPSRYLVGVSLRQPIDPRGNTGGPEFLPGVTDPRAATVVEVGTDVPVHLPDFAWPAELRVVTVRGRVTTSGGAAAAGAKVFANGGTKENRLVRAPAIADADGEFAISLLDGGQYALVADWHNPSEEKPWVLDEGETTAFTAGSSLPPFAIVVRPLPRPDDQRE